MKMVPINNFDNYAEAYLLKATLESHGISSFVNDEHISTMYGGGAFQYPVGGTRLMIHELDVPKVKEILADINNKPLLKMNGDFIQCPSCKSYSIQNGFQSNVKDLKGFFALVVSFFAGLSPFYTKRMFRCKNCDHVFDS